MLDWEVYKLYGRCTVKKAHGYEEQHLRDRTLHKSKRPEYVERHDEEF